MKKNLTPIISLAVGFILIFYSISIDGSVTSFIDIPSIIITIFGSLAALMVSYPFSQIKTLPRVIVKLISPDQFDKEGLIDSIVELARIARSQGLLALDGHLDELDNEFLVEGLRLVVDGMDPENIRDILETKVGNMETRHSVGQAIFSKWGELAPGFGMLGTLIGLINMLGSLTDPSTIGSGMAVALITTFYGSLLANLVFIPLAQNLQAKTELEVEYCEMIIESVLAVQSGQNPRVIEQKLISYLAPNAKRRNDKEDEAVPQSEGGGYV